MAVRALAAMAGGHRNRSWHAPARASTLGVRRGADRIVYRHPRDGVARALTIEPGPGTPDGPSLAPS